MNNSHPLMKIMAIILLFLSSQLAAGVVMAASGMVHSIVQIGYCILACNIMVIIALRALNLAGMRSAWAPPQYWLNKRLVLALLAILMLALSQSLLTEPLNLADMGTQAYFEAMAKDVWCILLLCVVGPLVEELVFRDGILRQLVRWGLSPLWAVVVSALIFGLVHGNPQQALPAIVLGIALGMLFARTGDLRLCLPAHIFNNTLAVALMYLPGSDDWTKKWSLMAHLIPGIILLLTGAYLIYRLTYADRKH